MKKQLIILAMLLLGQQAVAACAKPPKAAWFDRSECLLDGFAVVKKGKRYGVADAQGRAVLPAQYDRIGGVYRTPNSDAVFYQGLTMVGKGGRYGVADSQGNLLIPLKYRQAFIWSDAFRHGFELAQQDNGTYVLLDKTGQERLHLPYRQVALDDAAKRLFIDNGDGSGLVDTEGNILLPLGSYDEIDAFHNGLARVRRDGLFGYIGLNGEKVGYARFEAAGAFSEGRAMVRKDGFWRVLDTSGNVLPPVLAFAEVGPFQNGVAVVKDEAGLEGAINRDGQIILIPQYDAVQPAFQAAPFVYAYQRGRYAVFDLSGKQLTAFRFDRIVSDSEKAARVQENGVFYRVGADGKVLRER